MGCAASGNMDAKAAIIVGRSSGKIFYERNMREKLPIASLTKLATALVTVDEMLLNGRSSDFAQGS